MITSYHQTKSGPNFRSKWAFQKLSRKNLF